MFQPGNSPMPPQAGGATAAPAPAAAPAPPAPPMAAPQQGPRPVANIGFNQDVQNILLSRIQKLTPQEGKVMDTVITPQTLPVLNKIFPELSPLFQMILKQDSAQGPIGAPGAPGAPQSAPVPAATQGGGGGASAPSAGGQGDDEEEEEEEGESDNPLIKGPSPGLVG